eukprot:scaffold100128_cov17-Prasinocladus_malaysianus.AAC.1
MKTIRGRPRCGDDLYDFILAKIPPNPGPLRDAVLEFMLHGECGHANPNAPCMDLDNKSRSKIFPKVATELTMILCHV